MYCESIVVFESDLLVTNISSEEAKAADEN